MPDTAQPAPGGPHDTGERVRRATELLVGTVEDATDEPDESPHVHAVQVNPAEAQRSLAKAQRMAARTQVAGLEGGYRVWLEERTTTNDNGVEVTNLYLCWEGAPVRLPGGWKFVATAELLGDEPVTRMMPGYEGQMLDREWLAEYRCDHCGHRRRRSKIIIVENPDGERKRLGTNCCRDFLGWSYRASFLPDPTDLDDELSGSGPHAPTTINTEQLLTTAAMMARGLGWLSRSRASEYGGRATADIVSTYLLSPPRSKEHDAIVKDMQRHNVAPSPQDAEDVKRALAWINEQSPDSEYIANVQTALRQPTTRMRELGIVVSAVPVALAALNRQHEQAEAARRDGLREERYAPDGTRITTGMKVVAVSTFDSDYGPVHVHTMVGDGHRFQWKTGSIRLDEDTEYAITGTVKGVREHRDRTYTMLTRCKYAPSDT